MSHTTRHKGTQGGRNSQINNPIARPTRVPMQLGARGMCGLNAPMMPSHLHCTFKQDKSPHLHSMPPTFGWPFCTLLLRRAQLLAASSTAHKMMRALCNPALLSTPLEPSRYPSIGAQSPLHCAFSLSAPPDLAGRAPSVGNTRIDSSRPFTKPTRW